MVSGGMISKFRPVLGYQHYERGDVQIVISLSKCLQISSRTPSLTQRNGIERKCLFSVGINDQKKSLFRCLCDRMYVCAALDHDHSLGRNISVPMHHCEFSTSIGLFLYWFTLIVVT